MLLVLLACQPASTDKSSAPEDTDTETGTVAGPVPDARFDAFCGDTTWSDSLADLTLPETAGAYSGYNSTHGELKKGTVESSKIIPPHPFWVRTVRVQFGAGVGPARIRLMETMGRSYPGGYPDLDAEGVNLMTPAEVDVDASGGKTWVEIDVSDQGIFLLPTEHYVVVNEYAERGGPTVAITRTPAGENSRALLILPNEDTPYGIDGNFAMELVGSSFCTWQDDRRWFQPVTIPFADEVSASATVSDVNGDGHADVVSYGAGPQLWLGDGDLGFTAGDDPWPEASHASFLLFGDVDDDGDADAFAASYAGADDDGDGVWLMDGDCHNGDAAVHPGAEEVAANGRDDDCDGVADDGTDTTDADADGVSIAAGDCDDTDDTVLPGITEAKDGRDDDCDGETDEDHPSRILLNDGSGRFTALEAGVEVREPTTAAGFADANGDGALDLYFGNWLARYPYDEAVQDRYYEGVGDGTFVDARDAAGLTLPVAYSPYGLVWNDYDDDGWVDLFVATYHLFDDQLWRNQGDGTFVDVAADVGVAHDTLLSESDRYPGGHGYGGDWGDVDSDGDMDMFLANLSHPRTQPWADPSLLWINSGPPDYTFTDAREAWGLHYDEGDVNAQFADFDNDMDLDLVVASLYSTHHARVYRNDGGVFTDVTYQVGVNVEDAVSAIWFDADEDGDPDLLVGDRFAAPYLHLYENTAGQANHWVELDLVGVTGNRDAVGARVSLTAGGVTQLREVWDGNGCGNTQRPRRIHFGLGANTTIDSLTVKWPQGDTETITGASVDAIGRIVEGSGRVE